MSLKKIRYFSVIFFTVTLCFFILEIGLRFIGRGPVNLHEGIYEEYEDFYRYKENLKKEIVRPWFSYFFYTDRYGFRAPENTQYKNLKNTPFITFLGASDVVGDGLNYEETFVGIIKSYASKKGIEVINMAVGGHTFINQEILLKKFIGNKNFPKVVYFCFNDFTISNFDWKNFKSSRIKVINGDLYDLGNWLMAYIKMQLTCYSGSYSFLREKYRILKLKFGYSNTNSPFSFIDLYSKKNRIRQQGTMNQYINYLKKFESLCINNGIEPVYIYIPLADSFRFNDILAKFNKDPNQYDTSFHEIVLKKHCEKQNIKFISLMSEMKKYHNKGRELNFDNDSHYNAFSNKIIGEYLITEIFKPE
jgi:hypothetical protein